MTGEVEREGATSSTLETLLFLVGSSLGSRAALPRLLRRFFMPEPAPLTMTLLSLVFLLLRFFLRLGSSLLDDPEPPES